MITLAHGEGGWLTRQLIQQTIARRLDNGVLRMWGDSALLPATQSGMAFTTDSYVVTPLFFPGGDIGKLAVFGTVNDLVVAGAIPRWLSLSFIIEEGLPLDVLERVLESISVAAESTNVQIVTGDTKVVPHGAGDKLFINTSGIGERQAGFDSDPARICEGDALIVSGSLGRHGIAVLNARENLGLRPPPESDCGSLMPISQALRDAGIPVKAMRDATRGGLAAVLHEWAESSGCTLTVQEDLLPVSADVRGACELLGLDAIHIANEGVMVLAVPAQFADRAIDSIRTTTIGSPSAIVGRVVGRKSVPVTITRGMRTEHPLDLPSGAHLPRIC